MDSRAKLLGHPIHQQLIVFPLGAFGIGLLFDLIALFQNDGENLHRAAGYVIAAGIVGGLLAALFGLIDWLGIPDGVRAKRIGAMHGIGNVAVVVLFAAAWLLRRDKPEDPSTLPIVLEAVGVALSLVTGWLGGELVDRLGVGVYRGAHLDAPSSLSGRTALDRPNPVR